MVKSIQDDLDIKITCVPQGDHIPEAKRNNRSIGERICAAFHCLPYQMIPKVMMRALAKVATQQLNFFPAKNGALPYSSQHMLMNKKNINYKHHCSFTCGKYMQAHQEHLIKNDNKPCTIDCIYLEPTFNTSRGHYIMNIATGAHMHKKHVWAVPIMQTIINTVESLAKSQGYKSLKLLGKNKT